MGTIMADHAPATYEMIEVKADDIMPERTSFYSAFCAGTKWSIIALVVFLVLMAIFVV